MKIAVVAGASSGIGRAIAKELCEKYPDTFDEIRLCARSAAGLNETKAALESVNSSAKYNVRLVEGDLCDDNVRKLAAATSDDGGDYISWLVISAGTGKYGDFRDCESGTVGDVVELNCKTNAAILAEFLPKCRRGTKIINIASAAAFSPQPGFAVYAASKAFVLSLSRSLGVELKKSGITVTAVCPGPCDTEFLKKAREGKPIPAFKRASITTPGKVAKTALRDAAKGKSLSVPTLPMKLAHFAGKVLPSALVMRILYKGNKS